MASARQRWDFHLRHSSRTVKVTSDQVNIFTLPNPSPAVLRLVDIYSYLFISIPGILSFFNQATWRISTFLVKSLQTGNKKQTYKTESLGDQGTIHGDHRVNGPCRIHEEGITIHPGSSTDLMTVKNWMIQLIDSMVCNECNVSILKSNRPRSPYRSGYLGSRYERLKN